MVYPCITEEKPVFCAGSVSATVGSGLTYQITIPREWRRLETIIIHVNVTIAGPTSVASSNNGIEGIFKEIRFKVSDHAGATRNQTQCPSEVLLARNRFQNGRSDRYTEGSWRGKQATTYDLFIPIHIRDPLAPDPIGIRFGMPLGSDELAEDPSLEMDIAALADIGLSAGTVTINSVFVTLLKREVNPADKIKYIATEVKSTGWLLQGQSGPQTQALADKGWLGSLIVEGSITGTGRGDVLAASSYLQLLVGSSVRRTTTLKANEAMQDWWMRSYPSNASLQVLTGNLPLNLLNLVGVYEIDLWRDQAQGGAGSPASFINQNTLNGGDRAFVNLNLVANGTIRLTTFKVLETDLSLLQGA